TYEGMSGCRMTVQDFYRKQEIAMNLRDLLFGAFGQGNANNTGTQDNVVWDQAKGKSTGNERSKKKLIIAAIIIDAVIMFVAMYFLAIPLNVRSSSFWGLIFVLSLPICGLSWLAIEDQKKKRTVIMIPVAILAAIIVMGAVGAKIFHAHAYASVISLQDANFEDDLKQTGNTDYIALMDTDSAKMLGDREIGTLSGVVSQYNVSTDYAQIDYQGSPMKVAALEYAGFWKWWNNRGNGTPGYIIVDPVSMSASYVPLDVGMRYVPSAYFFQTAYRHIYFNYPTKITGDLHFETDEEGNPYYVTTVYEPTIGIFQAKVPQGAIIMDPTTGDMEYYALEDVPQWVDVVFTGTDLCDYYNWYGMYTNGFWNSLFGKKGCKQITTYSVSSMDDSAPAVDYGYVSKDGDIWIYTGITSINNDSSNIGFILANERTGETHYYTIAGADEQSAMNAAEGEVQEKGYQASFPSLINVDGTPTYIMVLKDASGLVKLYATVNVEQYNIVATAATQEECIDKYRALLGSEVVAEYDESESDLADDETDEDIAPESEDASAGESSDAAADDASGADSGIDESAPVYEADITVAYIQFIDIDGYTYCYLITDTDDIYKIRVSDNEQILLVKEGDSLHVTYQDGTIISWGQNNEQSD
ncbi:MAG: hypothetical protein LUC41_08285, partial [Clostridiales bacterium]|nr:hypothetical protein [Clostridiales bacterium]